MCPPAVHLDDDGHYTGSRAQQWLWDCWRDYWEQVERVADAEQAAIWVIMNGDTFENQHHGTTQLWSFNPADWQRAAEQTFAAVPHDRLYVVRGTEAHAGQSGHLEEQFARTANAVPNGELASWWTLDLEVAGVLFNVCHRGPLGRLPWTRPNLLNRLGYELRDEADHYRRRAPDVALRAHNHIAEENSPRARVRVFAQPSWQLRTSHVNANGTPRVADVGGMWFVCRDGEWTHQWKTYRPS